METQKNEISEIRNFLLRRPFGRPTPVWGHALESSVQSYTGKRVPLVLTSFSLKVVGKQRQNLSTFRHAERWDR